MDNSKENSRCFSASYQKTKVLHWHQQLTINRHSLNNM